MQTYVFRCGRYWWDGSDHGTTDHLADAARLRLTTAQAESVRRDLAERLGVAVTATALA